MTRAEILVGTRGSRLALAQTALVVAALEAAGRPCRVVEIETAGDRRAPDTAWGEGAFVAAIETALLAGQVDIAIHSAKDMPTDEDPRLAIGAFLPRADPRDALVLPIGAPPTGIDDLPAGARVGTDSPRRTGFVLARRPDLVVHPLHGNVTTRLARLDAGETDALVLACAGLDRIELGDRIAERLDPDLVPPAPGQGAIAVQARSDDGWMLDVLGEIDDAPTRLAVESERAFLAASGGGCRSPIGALAVVDGRSLALLAGIVATDGTDPVLGRRHGPTEAAQELGRALAADLRHRRPVPVGRQGAGHGRGRILVTRAADQADELVRALAGAGFDPVCVPTIAIEATEPGGPLDAAADRLSAHDWVVVTSTNGARAILAAADRTRTPLVGPRWAVIGPATAGVLEAIGLTPDLVAARATGAALAAELPIGAGDRALVVRGDLAGPGLGDALRGRGVVVEDVVAYRTLEGPEASRAVLRNAIAAGPIAAVAFTSGSTVRGLIALAVAESIDVRGIPAICIGPETARAAESAGFVVLARSPTPTADVLAATAARVLRPPLETTR